MKLTCLILQTLALSIYARQNGGQHDGERENSDKFLKKISWMMVDEYCANVSFEDLDPEAQQGIEYFCGECSNLSPEDKASNKKVKDCRAMMQGQEKRIRKDDFSSLVADICSGDNRKKRETPPNPLDPILQGAWEDACNFCSGMDNSPIESFTTKEIRDCRKGIQKLINIKKTQEMLDGNIYDTEEYLEVTEVCQDIWNGERIDALGGNKGAVINGMVNSMCRRCQTLTTIEDVRNCKKASEKVERFTEAKIAKFETKKIFKFTWSKVSKMCADIDAIENEIEYDVTAFCSECNPLENDGVDMDERKADCKDTFGIMFSGHKEEYKMQQFSWQNISATCNAGLDVSASEAKTAFFTNMCSRCTGQQKGKKGSLCRKKWNKFLKGKFDSDGSGDN